MASWTYDGYFVSGILDLWRILGKWYPGPMMDTQKVASWLYDISSISGILTNDKYTVSGHLGHIADTGKWHPWYYLSENQIFMTSLLSSDTAMSPREQSAWLNALQDSFQLWLCAVPDSMYCKASHLIVIKIIYLTKFNGICLQSFLSDYVKWPFYLTMCKDCST